MNNVNPAGISDTEILPSSRRWLIDQLEQIARTYINPLPKNTVEVEDLVYRKARNRAEYDWLGKNLLSKALAMARQASDKGSQSIANESSEESSTSNSGRPQSPPCSLPLPAPDSTRAPSTDLLPISADLKQVRYSVGGPLAIDQRTFVTPVKVQQQPTGTSQVAPPPRRLAKHTVSILTRSTVSTQKKDTPKDGSKVGSRQEAFRHYGPKEGSKGNSGQDQRGGTVLEAVTDGLKDGVKGVYKDGYKDGLKHVYDNAFVGGLAASPEKDSEDGLRDGPKRRQSAFERYGPKGNMNEDVQGGAVPGCATDPGIDERDLVVREDAATKADPAVDRSQVYEVRFTFLVPMNSKIKEMTIHLQPGDP